MQRMWYLFWGSCRVLSRSLLTRPAVPHARLRMQGRVASSHRPPPHSHISTSSRLLWSKTLTETSSLMVPPLPAPRQPARRHSASSTVVTTAESAVESSAGSTPNGKCGSTSTPCSIRRASCSGPAIAASPSTASGRRCGPADRIATAPAATHPLSRSIPPLGPNDLTPSASAVSPTASPEPGTGAPFRSLINASLGAMSPTAVTLLTIQRFLIPTF